MFRILGLCPKCYVFGHIVLRASQHPADRPKRLPGPPGDVLETGSQGSGLALASRDLRLVEAGADPG